MSKPLNTQIVEGAIAIMEDPDRWCQNTLAKDEFGRPVAFSSPAATRFCALGALARAAFDMLRKGDDDYDYDLRRHNAQNIANHICIHGINPPQPSPIKAEERTDLVGVNDQFGRLAALAMLKAHLEKTNG